jgi:hypothetical protein
MCEILLCEIRVDEIPAREIQIVDQFESVTRCAWPYSGFERARLQPRRKCLNPIAALAAAGMCFSS